MVWYGMVRYGTVWGGVVWFCVIWPSMVLYAWYDMKPYELVQFRNPFYIIKSDRAQLTELL